MSIKSEINDTRSFLEKYEKDSSHVLEELLNLRFVTWLNARKGEIIR
jgi:hypothetical protein